MSSGASSTPGSPVSRSRSSCSSSCTWQGIPRRCSSLRRPPRRRWRTSGAVLGLDDPFFAQYGRFLGNALRGEFGDSFIIRDKALSILLERAPATIELAAAGLLLGVAVAVPLGILAAYRPRTGVDHLASIVSVVGQAVPTFWLGILLILVFAVWARLVPVSGRSGFRSLILPAVCLGLYLAPIMMRLVRSGMLTVLAQDYVRTARAKGVTEALILWKHAFKNVSIPLVTMVGLQFGRLLAGTVVIEIVFAWPGIGFLTVKAVRTLDYPVVQAAVVVVGAAHRARQPGDRRGCRLPRSAHPLWMSPVRGSPGAFAPTGRAGRGRCWSA